MAEAEPDFMTGFELILNYKEADCGLTIVPPQV